MTIYFPDVSNHQAGLSLTGALACIAKASEGTGFRDPYFAGFRDQAAQLGIPFAGYHWLNTEDVTDQAELAFEMVGPDTPLMWDCEADGSTVERILAATDRYRKLGGVATLVYLPRWYWSSYLGSPDLSPLQAAGLSLISSHYTTYTDDGPGWNPYGGVYPTIWQFTSSYPFNGYSIDQNAYKGTVAELAAVFNGGSEEDMAHGDDIWNFIENGDRPITPDTWTPPGGYDSVPNNWMGTVLGKVEQDAYRTRVTTDQLAAGLADLQTRFEGFGEGVGELLTEIIARLRRLEPGNP